MYDVHVHWGALVWSEVGELFNDNKPFYRRRLLLARRLRVGGMLQWVRVQNGNSAVCVCVYIYIYPNLAGYPAIIVYNKHPDIPQLTATSRLSAVNFIYVNLVPRTVAQSPYLEQLRAYQPLPLLSLRAYQPLPLLSLSSLHLTSSSTWA